MDFIKEIRKKIGHDEIPLVAVTAFILSKDNKLLLIERTDNKKWGFPGGGLELREKVLDGLKREVYEETGIEVIKAELISIISGNDGVLYYPNEDIVSYTNLVFYIKEYQGCINESSDEALSIKFFDLNVLPKNLNSKVEEKVIDKWKSSDFSLNID